MKRLYFSFAFFLFSSLFILNGCYTTFRVQEKESAMYESVIPDSNNTGVNLFYFESYPFPYPYHFGWQNPWYYDHSFWYGPQYGNSWLWFGFQWNRHGFSYWQYPWHRYPLIPYRPHIEILGDQWRWRPLYNPFKIKQREDGRSRTRNNGERGMDVDRGREKGFPSGDDKDIDKSGGNNNVPPKKEGDVRTRGRDRVEKQPPPKTKESGEQNPRVDRKRENPIRTPQSNPNNGKSSNENPKKSSTTRDRGRG